MIFWREKTSQIVLVVFTQPVETTLVLYLPEAMRPKLFTQQRKKEFYLLKFVTSYWYIFYAGIFSRDFVLVISWIPGGLYIVTTLVAVVLLLLYPKNFGIFLACFLECLTLSHYLSIPGGWYTIALAALAGTILFKKLWIHVNITNTPTTKYFQV